MSTDKADRLRAEAEKHFSKPRPAPSKADRYRDERNEATAKSVEKTARLKGERLARDADEQAEHRPVGPEDEDRRVKPGEMGANDD